MSSILRALEFLSLGIWLGGIIFLSFVVAPGAFATLGNRDLAGAAVALALGRLHVLGMIAGLVYLAARATLARSLAALAAPAALAVILMLLLTLVSQQSVSPRLAHLRVEMGSVERTPAHHPLRVEFSRLHRLSVGLELAVLLAGLAALFLSVAERR